MKITDKGIAAIAIMAGCVGIAYFAGDIVAIPAVIGIFVIAGMFA